jgi:hypothetical protein
MTKIVETLEIPDIRTALILVTVTLHRMDISPTQFSKRGQETLHRA